ncbi:MULTISPECIES: N-acetylmuramoyl-L-alanine amidase family protein [Niastella]|uniref:N-acetylmuramoyl-L-alanine amidase n=1 Tax=Niastella soli TaxID=2821487 RepID=A0ABS3YYR3_9BACT|nr:N-acetylmuramoyl-L-alanine amidase [Niastella soli]MBO9202632.1 N-acetylmuramoyl-L-alanine amidase [Niastella soli]
MNKKKLYRCVKSFFVAGIFLFSGIGAWAQQKPVLGTIIIDPGHGGIDPGASGQFSTEAAVALSISLKLGQALATELPDSKLIFTRTTDELPGGLNSIHQALRYRADMANQAKGDLFIAIHCNANGYKAGGWYAKRVVGHKNRTVYVGKGSKRRKKTIREPIYESYWQKNNEHGTETYIWAADRTGFKGSAINSTGGNTTDSTGGEVVEDSTNVLDLNSPEALIRSQLYEKKYFGKSMLLATMVEDEFEKGGRLSRGVKQRNEKGIWVLQATGMPSILVETGFITQTEEEEYINSDKGQEEIVASIVNAIKRYKSSLEGGAAPAQQTTTPAPTEQVESSK